MSINNCFICDTPGAESCEWCGSVNSCPEHFTVHRNNNVCLPFTIRYSETMGHYMVATRDIKQMELILREEPVMVGPYLRPDQPHCVQCFKLVRGAGFEWCERCGFPVCGDQCSSGQYHSLECGVFSERGWRYSGSLTDYAAITVIRLLSMKTTSPDTYKRLMKLEDHNDRRREEDPDNWSYYREHVVSFIRDTLREEVSEEEILSVLGKMLTNSGDLQLDQTHARGCGYYPTYANMNHHCRANTKTFKYPDQTLEVRAQVSIARGEEISTQYLQSMKPTFIRRPVLRSKWFFDCLCSRCLDPTEHESYLSSLLCTVTSGDGRVQCGGCVVSQDPSSGDSDWVCSTCDHLYSSQHVLDTLSAAAADADQAEETDANTVEHYERVIWKYSSLLHPNNTILVDIKMKLAQILGNFAPFQLMKMSRPVKERKIQLCQEMLEIISKVDPGFTKTRGIMLSEMNKTRLVLAKQNMMDNPGAVRVKKDWEKACLEKQFLNMYLVYYQNMFHNKERA